MRFSVTVGVAVEKTVYRFDKPFDYSVPLELIDVCKPGCRVTVPFGRGNTKRQGIVLYVSEKPLGKEKELKNVISVIDKTPILNAEFLGLVKWMKDHTFCTYYDAVKTLIPFGLNLKMVQTLTINKNASAETFASLSATANDVVTVLRKKGGVSEKSYVLKTLGLSEDADCFNELSQKGVVVFDQQAKQNMKDPTVSMVRLVSAEVDGLKLTPKQKAVVELLLDVGTAGVKEVAYFAGVTNAVISTLEKRNIVTVFQKPTIELKEERVSGNTEEIVLTKEQQSAFEKLSEDLEKDQPKTSLLYGVTGSGKTSVFLKLVDKTIKSGKNVIVMVPEISLTPQTISKFKNRYGDKIAVFHSAMSLGQRMEQWKKVAKKKAVIAIGTRSAVFAPFENIGLIIMDEEQEHTYKSEQSPRFNARDIAKLRCKYHNAMLLLASATPSVESFCLAENGNYGLVKLKNRYGDAILPEVITVDMKEELSVGNTKIISRRLADELSSVLESKKQAILLLNRRGHNTYISCPSCGHVFSCENCSISLTYHSANKKLMCHYCGAAHAIPTECPVCKNNKLRFSGIGTQRADTELKEMFPNAKILRLDADTTMTRDAFETGLSAFAKGEYDILLGTQMVAKGLDFPNVTLVGVLSADQSLYSDDFRSFERTFSLLTQVIGRSGRGKDPGIAIVQTAEPNNDIIELACQQDYESFYSTEIATRKLMIYPPYCDIVMLGVSAVSSDLAKKSADKLFALIKAGLEKPENSKIKVIILGPTAATVPRVNSKYRQRIILKTKNTVEFRRFLDSVLLDFYTADDKRVNVFVDINPESLI